MNEQSRTSPNKEKKISPSNDGDTSRTPESATNKRNDVSTEIGKKLRAIRLERKLSQENLAFNAQFDRAFISDIERGVANPSIMALATLCYALNITLADFFESINLSLKPGDITRRKNPSKTDGLAVADISANRKQVPKIR